MTSDVTAIRLQLRRDGFHPIPVEGKRPPLDGWPEKINVTEEEIRLWPKTWHFATGTGILAKDTPGLDDDITIAAAADAIEALAREFFEEYGDIHVRFGNSPKRLIPLRTDEPFTKLTRVFTAPDGTEQKIEILGDGQQYVVAGIHPLTGKPYSWFGGELGTFKREDLPYVRCEDMQRFLDAATKLLVEDFSFVIKSATNGGRGPHKGGEPQADLERLAAALAVIPNNFDWDGWNRIVMAFWRATGGSAEGFALVDAWSRKSPKYDARTTAEKWAALFKSPPDIIGAGSIFHLADHADPNWDLDYKARKHEQDGPPEPPPEEPPEPEPTPREPEPPRPPPTEAKPPPIFDPWERHIVPPFPLEILPPVLQEFVTTQSKVIGACSAAMAMATLTAVSAATSHRWSLKMMQHGQWYEHPRLWVLIVGDPSVKKTPEMDAATKPLEYLQAEVYRDYKLALEHYEQAGEEDDVQEPEEPPRYVVMDTTIQKLGEILSRADRGLLVKRDELTGWIGDMDRYNKGTHAVSDRAFWLKAWDGGPYLIDRISRPSDFVENLSVSILGGIQPDRLAELKDLTSDGLLQRFLPVIAAQPSFTLDEPANVNPYWALIRQLVDMPPQHLSMTADARERITELRRHLFELEKVSGGIGTGFQTFLGKLHGYSGRLAIILHLVEFPKERFVAGKVAENVCRMVREFLIPHAFEFYSLGESGDQLKRLASYILTCDKDRILASDLTANVRDLRGRSLFDVRERASVLVAGGWLDPVDRTPMCKAWRVNPALKVRFAEQARNEAERKRLITEMLGARKHMAST